MKILFISHPALKIGSHRIWVHDLCIYFNKIGVTAKIGTEQEIPHYDVIIYGKSETPRKIKNKIVGHINPVGWKKHNCDFIITGSLEERDSLLINDNVFIFPLIENMFLDKTTKKHKDTSLLKICYHGHETHLASFNPHLKAALEDFSKEKNIELTIIHGNEKFNWSYGKPHVKTIYKKWNINTVSDDIKACDIGVCPNSTEVSKRPHKMEFDKGLFDSDYILRFKNKSNAGRSFVFHQLGIPVIADLTPSHFHILGNPDNGYVVMSKNGWLGALRELSDHNQRNFMAENARLEFDRLYNPIEWAKDLYENINKIYLKKK